MLCNLTDIGMVAADFSYMENMFYGRKVSGIQKTLFPVI